MLPRSPGARSGHPGRGTKEGYEQGYESARERVYALRTLLRTERHTRASSIARTSTRGSRFRCRSRDEFPLPSDAGVALAGAPQHVAPGMARQDLGGTTDRLRRCRGLRGGDELAFLGYLVGTESTGGPERRPNPAVPFQEAFETHAARRLCARQDGRVGGHSGVREGRCGGRGAARRGGGGAEAGGDRGGRGSSGHHSGEGGEAGSARCSGHDTRARRDTQARRDPDSDSDSRARARARCATSTPRTLHRPRGLPRWLAREPSFVLVGEDDPLALRPHHEPIGDAPPRSSTGAVSFQAVSRGRPRRTGMRT